MGVPGGCAAPAVRRDTARRVLLLATVAAVALATPPRSTAETGVAPAPDAVSRGLALYRQHCIGCHRKDGRGTPRIPWGVRHPDLIEAMPLDETSHAWHHSDEQLVATILGDTRAPGRRMPSFGGILTRDQVTDLVAYIKSLWSERILACQGPGHMRCM
jgi:mono/diheme cytochrome c family protein